MNTTADNTQDRQDEATAADIRAGDRCAMCKRISEGHGSRSASGALVKKPTPSIKSHQFISSRSLPTEQVEQVTALNRTASPIERLEYQIRHAGVDLERVKVEYIKACESMARSITQSAEHARAGHYVSETVMSSSLVADIPKYAIEYRMLAEQISALRFILADLKEAM